MGHFALGKQAPLCSLYLFHIGSIVKFIWAVLGNLLVGDIIFSAMTSVWQQDGRLMDQHRTTDQGYLLSSNFS